MYTVRGSSENAVAGARTHDRAQLPKIIMRNGSLRITGADCTQIGVSKFDPEKKLIQRIPYDGRFSRGIPEDLWVLTTGSDLFVVLTFSTVLPGLRHIQKD